MLELRLLGALEAVLAEQSGTSLLAQPKRAALVVYLALSSRTGVVRRDRLLALFWPDADEAHARRALNQALHYLRGVLGAAAPEVAKLVPEIEARLAGHHPIHPHAKLPGALAMMLILFAATLIYPIAMFKWPWTLGPLDWGPVTAGYLGLILFSGLNPIGSV